MEQKPGHYSDWLLKQESVSWKRLIDVQAPYRWNIRRLNLGFTLDLGCGLGRNLAHLGGKGVGVDTDVQAISVARERGFKAYQPDEFFKSDFSKPASFDSLLASHCLEHMDATGAVKLLQQYLPMLKQGGKLVLITPQEVGYASDVDHKNFLDFSALEKILDLTGRKFKILREYSFPFPRAVGKVFRHNEFVLVAELM
jgi:SAM-dependent methyltransferase